MHKMMKLQGAAEHAPDRFNALALFRASGKVKSSDIVKAVAGLLTQAETIELTPSGTLHVLVAIAPKHLSNHDAAEAIDEQWSQKTEKKLISGAPAMQKLSKEDGQADVLVQVAASVEDDRVFALRLAEGILRQGGLELAREWFGTPQLVNRDPFGFRSAIANPWEPKPGTGDAAAQRDEFARIADGPLEGASWLLHRQYVQDVDAFIKLDPSKRERVIGTKPNGSDLPDSPRKSHVGMARRYREEGRGLLVRRGFHFREDGQEGLAFLAIARELEAFLQADEEMEGGDAILDFVTGTGGGVYLVPPTAEWLLAGVRPAAVPPAAKDVQRYEAPLELLEVVPAFKTYMMLIKLHGTFVGDLGQQRVMPEVANLVREAHKIIAKKSSPKEWEELAQQMDDALNKAITNANAVNDQAGEYITIQG